MKVADVVSKKYVKLISVESHTRLNAIYDQMKAHGVHHLAVMQGNSAVGIIDRDALLDAIMLSPLDFNFLEAKDIMRKDVAKITWETELEEALSLMQEHQIGALPLYEDQECIGLITRSDFFRLLSGESIGGDVIDDVKAKSEVALSNPVVQKILKLLADIGI